MNKRTRYVWSDLLLSIGFPLIVTLVATFVLCSAVGAHGQPEELTVSAAASLKNAFEDMGRAFEAQKKGVRIYLNFASSGDLAKQIGGGAPVDVFASAAQREMDGLEAKGLVVQGTRRPFARNEIVLARPAKSTLKISRFEDLRKPEIKLISIGNPASVPAGLYASETLRFFTMWDGIKDKLVFGESVRQVLDYVARGEVDAGMVFSTDARSRPNEVTVVASAPMGSHRPIIYPIAAVRGTKREALACDFIRFVVSEPGRKILQKYGFSAAE